MSKMVSKETPKSHAMTGEKEQGMINEAFKLKEEGKERFQEIQIKTLLPSLGH